MYLLSLLIPIANAAASTDATSESSNAITSMMSFIFSRLDNWIAAILVMLFSFYFAKLVKKIAVDRVADKMGDEHEDVLILVGRATYAIVLIIGLTVGLKVGGIDLTAVIAAVGFGVGFALQDIIMNFISGVLILASRQFTIGDFIEVNGTMGKVKEIQARATILQAIDGTRIIVPNADLFTNKVTSFTTNPFRRIELVIGVNYGTNIAKAMNVLLAVVKAHPKVIKKPAPSVIMDDFGVSSMDFKVRFWVSSKDSWLNVKSQVLQQINDAFSKAGIGMPYNTMNLVLDPSNEQAVLPIKNMTAEDMKQFQMERIQAEEAQTKQDSENPDVKDKHEGDASHTDEEDLEYIEQVQKAEEQAKAAAATATEAGTAPTQEQPVVVAPQESTVAPAPAVDATVTIQQVSAPTTTPQQAPIPVSSEPVLPRGPADPVGADFLARQ